MKNNAVKMWEEKVSIPTYEVGKKNVNPMFLEKRVYQGSSGRVYPNPVIDKIYNEKADKEYNIIFLENDYIQIQIMPEIGGRIYRALDKTNNYDFVYYNHVIKPALVGLAGPWISGGIEFNWPQHHRPNTFGDVEYSLKENEDGSKTVWVGEIDSMYGTKVTTGFTLYPDRSYLKISAQLYNRTGEPQTFLWWANPAVEVHDETQSIFPPDVNAVFDHGKRDVSKFPIATGVYYKQDYSRGVDISRYKNIPVPTSYMAYHSDYNFVGGYDYRKKAGILHIADHHVSPGKKQWTWGCGDFGKAWDRNLTDEDGPYIELMTGVYTDNQPDFTWLQPYEEKTFTQYFMPYKEVGQVKNASTDIVMGLEVENNTAYITVYSTHEMSGVKIKLANGDKVYLEESADISPVNIYKAEVQIDCRDYELTLSAYRDDGRLLLDYTPAAPHIEDIPDPAKAIGAPETLKNTETLYLAGMHLEQYRHATYEPDPYYLEGLKRDPEDIRLNNAYGNLIFRRGEFKKAEEHFRKAIKTATRHSPNPYDGEPYYNLGKALFFQGKTDEAYDAFFKSTWSSAWQAAGYFDVARIDYRRNDMNEALEHVEHSLYAQYRNYKARNLKSNILRDLGRLEEAERFTLETAAFDRMEPVSRNELSRIYEALGDTEKAKAAYDEFVRLLRGDQKNCIAAAIDYMSYGNYAEAAKILRRGLEFTQYPMMYYYLAFCEYRLSENYMDTLAKAAAANSDYCFPNTIHDYSILKFAIKNNPADAKALYYIGDLLYDKKRYEDAIAVWEKSIELDGKFPTAKRNLALAYVNKRNDCERGLKLLEEAFELNKSDSRVFYELDQLYKKLNRSPEERLEKMNQNFDLVNDRDDLFLEYITIYNLLGEHKKALELILGRDFHPWEGGEGKIPTQYVHANLEIAKSMIDSDPKTAIEYLTAAKTYPLNVGEGKLAGAQENNINYYLGIAYRNLGDEEKSKEAFEAASVGLSEPTGAMYYNDQPPYMIFYQGTALRELGRENEALSRFHKLVDYGEAHIFDEQSIDYFAVSLPDFLVFDVDLNVKNKIHCNFMMGIGYIGLGDTEKAEHYLKEALKLDPYHQGAMTHLELLK